MLFANVVSRLHSSPQLDSIHFHTILLCVVFLKTMHVLNAIVTVPNYLDDSEPRGTANNINYQE